MIIKGYSKAKYSTWIYYTPLSVLFDAGEGINCFLEERLVTISDILLSHGHTDHYTGLINVLMTKLAHYQSSGVEFPTRIFYPGDDPTLVKYIEYVIDAYRLRSSPVPIEFIPVKPGERHELNSGRRTFLETFRVDHTKDVSSIAYRLGEIRTKLKDEYKDLSQSEIQKLIVELGKENITFDQDKYLVVYSGDCKPLDPKELKGSDMLIHEATFFEKMDRKGQLHSTIDEVFELVEGSGLKELVLFHFSSRYTGEQIYNKIKKEQVRFPDTKIHYIIPGKVFYM